MKHQDWNNIIINASGTKEKTTLQKKSETSKSIHVTPPETIKMEAPSNLGQLISQARNTKKITQKALATDLQISPSILSRWETNKEVPTNGEIAKIEKKLGVKLPRSKKVKVDPH